MPFRVPPTRTRRATHRLVMRLSLACVVGAAAAVPLLARTGQVSARGRTAHSVAIPRPPAVTPTARVTASPTPAPPPVVTPYPSPVPGRTWAGPTYLVGAYYFSGWSHGQSDNLTSLLTTGPMRRYEPITGWYDDSQAQVDKAIDQAAGAGIGFFAFDWYNLLRSHYATDKSLNDALRFYLSSKHRYRLKFCLNFVDQAPFLPHAGDWPLLVNTWIKYFKQPDYVRVDGKPLFIIFSPEHMRDIFGGSKNVHKALDYLRWAVRKAGLPGVTIAVGTTVTPTANPYHLAMLRTEGYDVTTGYNYHAIGHEQYRTPAPYSDLVRENEQMWDRVIATYTQPYIPVITMNWDQRFSAREQKTAIIYDGRTPEQFTCYASAARRWIDEHPTRTPRERIVLVFAWNEIGEGSALIPNKVDGYTYLNVIRRVFGAPGQPPGPEPC